MTRVATESTRPVASHRAAVVTLVMVYAMLLAAVYEYVVSPRFAYLGFVSVSPDPLYVMLDALACGGLALLLPKHVTRPSELGRILVFFLVTVPAVVIPTFLSEEWNGVVIEAKTFGVLGFLVVTAVLAALPRGAVPRLRLPGDLSLFILLALAVVAVFVLGSSYRFAIEIHPLTDVYDQREIYSEGGGGSGIVGLSAGLLQNVLAPIFLVVGMHRRSLLYFGLGLVLLLFIYSVTGLKSALIGVGFVIGVYALARLTKAAAFTRAWSAVAIAFVSVAWLVASVPVLSIANDLVVRRILVMQGMLAYNYIQIFGGEEPTYFSHTIFGTFFSHPFQGRPPEIVGQLLFGRAVHANASFVFDGYVSARLLGVLIAAVVVALFLALIDALSTGLEPPVVLAATCMVIYITTQSGVVTALLNHGGVALVGCLWLGGSALAVGHRTKTSRDGMPHAAQPHVLRESR